MEATKRRRTKEVDVDVDVTDVGRRQQKMSYVEKSLDVDQKDVHVDEPPFSANSFDIFAGFLNCKMGRGQFIREQSNVKHKN